MDSINMILKVIQGCEIITKEWVSIGWIEMESLIKANHSAAMQLTSSTALSRTFIKW